MSYVDVQARETEAGLVEIRLEAPGLPELVVLLGARAARDLHRMLDRILHGDEPKKVPGLMSRRSQEIG